MAIHQVYLTIEEEQLMNNYKKDKESTPNALKRLVRSLVKKRK